MSVTGRMVGTGIVVSTGGVGESIEGVWPESMGGGGLGEGETVTGLGGVGEGEDLSITQEEVESELGGWESMPEGMGESLGEGVDVDFSTFSIWMEMSECAQMEGGGSMEVMQSEVGTREGVVDEVGDSNVELGGGSMMGVVQINKEAGTV